MAQLKGGTTIGGNLAYHGGNINLSTINLTALCFIGSGAGLTGTAANLTVGTATNATNATNATVATCLSGYAAGNANYANTAGGVAWSAISLQPTQSNWSTCNVNPTIAGMLTWRNYGNSHVIFDASAGVNPCGGASNNSTPNEAWTSTYPTLMGWNGSFTYGVKVNRADYADGSATANNSTCAGGLLVHTGTNSEANKIVRTDGSGYLFTGYINSGSGNEGNNSSPARVWGTNGSDSYLRTYLTSALNVSYATNSNYATSAGNATCLGGYNSETCILSPIICATTAYRATGTGYKYCGGTGCGTAVDWIATSDCRIKKCIEPITSALSMVNALCGVCYELCENNSKDMGLIAQDVFLVEPRLVAHSEPIEEYIKYGIGDEILSLKYDKFAGLFVEAIKELKLEVESLKTEIKTLKDEKNI